MPALVTGDFSRIALRKRRETVGDRSLWGTWDPGALRTLNLISEGLEGNPEDKRSGTSMPTRHPGPSRRVAVTGGGQLAIEMVYGPAFDELLEDALFNTWSNPLAISSNQIQFVASGNKIIDAGSSGALFTSVVPGTWVKIGGHSQSWTDNFAYVVSKAANEVVLAYQTVTNAAAGATITITGSHLRDGSQFISNWYEREYLDFTNDRFQSYPGQVVQSIEMMFTFEEMVKATLALTGMGPLAPQASSQSLVSFTAADDVAAGLMDVSNNMRAFRSNGALYGNVKDFKFTLNNNTEYIKLGQGLQPAGISLGTANLSGQLDGYLVDADGRRARAFSNSYDNFHLRCSNDLGTYFLTLFKARYKKLGDKGKSAASGPTPFETPFECDFDAATNCWLQFCKFAA